MSQSDPTPAPSSCPNLVRSKKNFWIHCGLVRSFIQSIWTVYVSERKNNNLTFPSLLLVQMWQAEKMRDVWAPDVQDEDEYSIML